MYKSIIKETNSVLNTCLQKQDNQSLSSSQISTQPNQSGLINYRTTEAGNDHPAVMITQQPNETSTEPQDSPIIRKVSTLMDMIHTLQEQITTLNSQVNDLVSQAIYRSVDETHISDTSKETVVQPITETDMTKHSNSTNLLLTAETSQQGPSFARVFFRKQTCLPPQISGVKKDKQQNHPNLILLHYTEQGHRRLQISRKETNLKYQSGINKPNPMATQELGPSLLNTGKTHQRTFFSWAVLRFH